MFSREVLPPTDIFVRAHHLYDASLVRSFLKLSPPKKLSKVSAFRATNFNDQVYARDVYGTTSAEKWSVYSGFRDFEWRLNKASETSFIEAGMDFDGFCNSCVIGRHCAAVNYEFIPEVNEDFLYTDEQARDILRESIEDKGYELGLDYFIKPTTITLYDYQGSSLDSLKPAIPVERNFDAIVVSAGVLRNVMRRDSRFPKA